jgi:hypothetical protein
MRFLAVVVWTNLFVCGVGFGQRPEKAAEQQRFALEEPFVHPKNLLASGCAVQTEQSLYFRTQPVADGPPPQNGEHQK